MENSRDSSVWRSLAVAFGDGLAFGVGMKLSQPGAAKPAAPADTGVAARLDRIEHRVERIERAPAAVAGSGGLDPQVLEALTRALESRLQENTALMDRRLAEFDIKVALELNNLRQQDQSLAADAGTRVEALEARFEGKVRDLLRQMNDERNGLQNQVISLHREFASAVADIVEEQVATQVEARVATLVEQRLAGLVRAELAPVEQQLREDLRVAFAAKHREIADLRQHVMESDRNILDVLLSTSEAIRQAAGRLGAPEPGSTGDLAAGGPALMPEPPALPEAPAAAPEPNRANASEPAPAAPPETAHESAPTADSDLPGFAKARRAAAGWSIPLVTSFLVTAGCVFWLQYL